MEKLRGQVLRVISDKGSWAAVSFKPDDGPIVSCAGSIIAPQIGMTMELTGEMYNDPKWGLQFKVSSSKPIIENQSEIVDYLSSAFIKGIGPVTAQKIYDTFGKDSVMMVEKHPEEVAKIKGMSMTKALTAQQCVRENHAYLDILEFFNGQATSHQVQTLYDKYGTKAVEVLKENPYTVIYDVEGFGFKRADALAKASGITASDPKRVCAAIIYTLKTLSFDGHCFCLVDSLEENMKILVEDVPLEKVSECVIKEIQAGHLVLDDDRLYEKNLYDAETLCAKILVRFVKDKSMNQISQRHIDASIRNVEYESGFELERKQKEAVLVACKNRVSVITGGPGTGKTTIVKAIVRAAEMTNKVVLAAPTGKASRRMSELTDGHEATTIHRMLMDFTIHGLQDAKKPFFVIDEASMLDIDLASKLLSAVYRFDGSVVFIGDIDQLPPIGPGNFLRDLVESVDIPTVRLELSHRQKGKIATNANRINTGKGVNTFAEDSSFRFIDANTDKAQQLVIDNYINMVSEYGVRDVCCLTPIRKKGRSNTAAETLNEIIREKLNPEYPGMPVLKDFRLGDRVMETVNDNKRDVYNGDCGVVTRIDTKTKALYVVLDDGREVEYNEYNIDSLTLAYAMTVHKSQGSEFKGAVIVNGWDHYIMLQRNLLYTAVTRAREKVVLIGTPKSINMAVRTVKDKQRNTRLKKRIMEGVLAR